MRTDEDAANERTFDALITGRCEHGHRCEKDPSFAINFDQFSSVRCVCAGLGWGHGCRTCFIQFIYRCGAVLYLTTDDTNLLIIMFADNIPATMRLERARVRARSDHRSVNNVPFSW